MKIPPMSDAEKRRVLIYSLYKRGLKYNEIANHPACLGISRGRIYELAKHGKAIVKRRIAEIAKIKSIAGMNHQEITTISIEDAGFDRRSYNCVRNAGASTLPDVLNMTPEYILSVKNAGKQTLRDLQTRLNELGFKSGYPIFEGTGIQPTPKPAPASMATVQKAIALLERHGYTVIPPKEP